jgi:hypothetical protein
MTTTDYGPYTAEIQEQAEVLDDFATGQGP